MIGGCERGSELARAVGGIGEDLESCGLACEESGCGLGVTDIAGSEIACGDKSGIGFDRDVGFEAVAVLRAGLVHVAGLGVDG